MKNLTNLIPSPANRVLSGPNGWVDLTATYSVGSAHPASGNYSRITETATNNNQRRYYLTTGAGSAKTIQCTCAKVYGGSGTRFLAIADNTVSHSAIWNLATGANTITTGVNSVATAENLGTHWRFTLTSSSGLLAALVTVGHSNGAVLAYLGDLTHWIDVSDVVVANELYTAPRRNHQRLSMRIGL